MRGDMDVLEGRRGFGPPAGPNAPWTIWDLPGAPKAPEPSVVQKTSGWVENHPEPAGSGRYRWDGEGMVRVGEIEPAPVPAPVAPKPPGPDDEWMRRWLRRR